jgi:hypothetical protein
MSVQVFLATALVLLVGTVTPIVGQERNEELATRLKAAVDRSLDRFVLDLRKELHRTIDAAYAESSDRSSKTGASVISAAGATTLIPPVRASDSPTSDLDPAAREQVWRILQRLETLATSLGEDHAEVAGVRRSLEEDLGPLAGTPLIPWARVGLSVAPASDAFRTLHRLPDGVGFRVAAVDPAGPAALAGLREGDVIVGVGDQGALGPLTEAAVRLGQGLRLAADPTDLRLHVVEGRAHRPDVRRMSFPPPPELSSKSIVEDHLRRALEKVLSGEGMILPVSPDPPGQGHEPPGPQKRPDLQPRRP